MSDSWYDKPTFEVVFGSMEPSLVMVTAGTAFENSPGVSGP